MNDLKYKVRILIDLSSLTYTSVSPTTSKNVSENLKLKTLDFSFYELKAFIVSDFDFLPS